MKLALVLTAALLTACSSNPGAGSAKTANADAQDGVVCTYERPMDSFVKVKKCTTAAERSAERNFNELHLYGAGALAY